MENLEGINRSPESAPPIPLNNPALIKCLKCAKEHSGEEICVNKSDAYLTHMGDSEYKFVFKCINCSELQEHKLVGDLVDKISKVLWQYDKDHGIDYTEETYSCR